VDLIIGAKGSPLQLVLSSLYHNDIPTGNIPLQTYEQWKKNPQIENAIPLALGDNFKGYRIVGTTPDWFSLYKNDFDAGQIWQNNFEAVLGADVARLTGLKLGDQFAGAHGLLHDTGPNAAAAHTHDEFKYRVVGILKESGTIADRLILTSYQSVIDIHKDHDHEHETGHDHEHKHDHEHTHNHAHKKHADKENEEITALLLDVKSPVAVLNLPRRINQSTELMAANPSLEMARLTQIFGLGTSGLFWIAGLLCAMALLSLVIGIVVTAEQKMNDYSLLRVLGFSKGRIYKILILELMIVCGIGIALGLMSAYGLFQLLPLFVPSLIEQSALTVFNWSLAGALSFGAFLVCMALSLLLSSKVMNRSLIKGIG
jgi:putative ABC transport system permease protein